MANFQEIENIVWPNAKRKIMKESMTDSCEMTFSDAMIENSRDEKVCRAWDVLADEDHTYHMSQEEYFYYRNNWWLHLNKSGNDTQSLRKRSDSKQALSTLKRSHREAGREQIEPVPYWKYKQWRPASSSSLPGGNGKIPGGLPKNSKKVKKDEASKKGL